MNPSSYHDGIQADARAIEASRVSVYDRTALPSFTVREFEYLYGATYKLLRILNNATPLSKVKDDVLDSYNYCALLYEALSQRDYRQRLTSRAVVEPMAKLEGVRLTPEMLAELSTVNVTIYTVGAMLRIDLPCVDPNDAAVRFAALARKL